MSLSLLSISCHKNYFEGIYFLLFVLQHVQLKNVSKVDNLLSPSWNYLLSAAGKFYIMWVIETLLDRIWGRYSHNILNGKPTSDRHTSLKVVFWYSSWKEFIENLVKTLTNQKKFWIICLIAWQSCSLRSHGFAEFSFLVNSIYFMWW